MIRYVEQPDEGLFEGWEAGALQRAQIEALLLAGDRLDVWLQTGRHGRACALLARQEQGTIIAAAQTTDGWFGPHEGRELREFLSMTGCAALETEGSLGALLGLVPARRWVVLEGPWEDAAAGPSARALSAGELFSVARQAFALKEEDYPAWLCRFSRRLRRGGALALGISHEGRLAAAGALSHVGVHCALLGYIGVLPPFRGLGLGREITAALLASARQGNRRPLLACRRELVPYYRAMGFQPLGEQAVLFIFTETEQ